MKYEPRHGSAESSLSLSFVDVLSCGFGAMIFVFLVFSILPHFAGGQVGSVRPSAQLQPSSEGIGSKNGPGLQDQGVLATAYPPLLAQLEVPIRPDTNKEKTGCDERGALVDLSLLQWEGPAKRTTQTIIDCEAGIAKVQVLWEAFPDQTLRVTVPNEALRHSPLKVKLLVLSVSGETQPRPYTLSRDRPRGQQALSVPIAQARIPAVADSGSNDITSGGR